MRFTGSLWKSTALAALTYAVNSGAVTLFPAVGYAAVFSSEGLVTAKIEAAVPFDEQPLLYATIHTTTFSNAMYDVNGEQSWGVLQQITRSFPSCIPRVEGTYVEHRTITLQELLA
jgi:nitrilase